MLFGYVFFDFFSQSILPMRAECGLQLAAAEEVVAVVVVQWLIDLELNLEEIPGLDPDVDSYANEVEFKEDLRMMDVRTEGQRGR